jgi:hypothetical protein|tara:strand:- start:1610 stop:2101 length:492 start_codon:yes stop_codon:yes gene_type:complete
MFSNKMAIPKCLGAVIILLLLGSYAHYHGASEDQKAISHILKCVNIPDQCLNEPLVIRIRTKGWTKNVAIAEVKTGKNYYVEKPINVAGIRGRQQVGRVVDLLGYFDERQKFVVVRQREDDWIQTTKYIVSLLGLGLCLWLFVACYSFTPGLHLPMIPRSLRR